MVLQVAKKGGLSMIASSVAVRNEIARRRPDLLKSSVRAFLLDLEGQLSSRCAMLITRFPFSARKVAGSHAVSSLLTSGPQKKSS